MGLLLRPKPWRHYWAGAVPQHMMGRVHPLVNQYVRQHLALLEVHNADVHSYESERRDACSLALYRAKDA